MTALDELKAAAELPPASAGYHTQPALDRLLGMILERCLGDVDLAADAIAQCPRPRWVHTLLGPTYGMVERPVPVWYQQTDTPTDTHAKITGTDG